MDAGAVGPQRDPSRDYVSVRCSDWGLRRERLHRASGTNVNALHLKIVHHSNEKIANVHVQRGLCKEEGHDPTAEM